MMEGKRSLHLRLQEYCDCFVETDPKRELDALYRESRWVESTDEGYEEVALKFLGLAILYGIKESAKRISVIKTQQGDIRFNIEATGKYQLPAPSPTMVDHVFSVMRSITHVESPDSSQKLALGLRNDSLELEVKFGAAEGKDWLDIVFP